MHDLTPIQNFRRLVDGGSPDWIPFSVDVGALSGLSAPVEKLFHQKTGRDDPAEYFQADVRCFSLPTRFGGEAPEAFHESLKPGTTFDEWGVGHWAGGRDGTVDRMYPPLASARTVDDIDALPLPAIDTSLDTSPVERHHAAGYPVFGYAGSIYEWSWWLRGMENFLTDLVANESLAEAVIAKVCRHTTRLALATASVGVDVLCMYDDAGMQTGMQLSPALWRRHIKPAWRHVLTTVRDRFPNVKFFLHSCSKIDSIVPDIVELGFHLLHPVQPDCMDFEPLWRQFGQDIVLAAAISSQTLFPFGSPSDIRREVNRLAKIAGESRRAIFMPSNAIQPETPWENLLAFVEAARALRGTR
jgi:uroporphyrinogen decarboxylase